jgi:transcription elongation factor Elf1
MIGMPVVNTACPYCGHETIANVPDEKTKIKKVSRSNVKFRYYDSKAGCNECGEQFYIAYN